MTSPSVQGLALSTVECHLNRSRNLISRFHFAKDAKDIDDCCFATPVAIKPRAFKSRGSRQQGAEERRWPCRCDAAQIAPAEASAGWLELKRQRAIFHLTFPWNIAEGAKHRRGKS